MASPTTENRKCPGSVRPAWTGPTRYLVDTVTLDLRKGMTHGCYPVQVADLAFEPAHGIVLRCEAGDLGTIPWGAQDDLAPSVVASSNEDVDDAELVWILVAGHHRHAIPVLEHLTYPRRHVERRRIHDLGPWALAHGLPLSTFAASASRVATGLPTNPTTAGNAERDDQRHPHRPSQRSCG